MASAESTITNLVINLIKEFVAVAYKEYKVIKGVGDQLKSLENDLKFMRIFLRDSVGKQEKHELVRELIRQIEEVAFEAEDLIESIILSVEMQRRRTLLGKVFYSPHYANKLREMAEKVNTMKKRVEAIDANKKRWYDMIKIGEANSMNSRLEEIVRRRGEVDEQVEGFQDVTLSLLNQLFEGSNRLEVISLVGMAGLGKTTIAKKLLNNGIIRALFENRCAWVLVSEEYDTRQVILTILDQMKYVAADDPGEQDTQELKRILRSHLSTNRYLIFLDDVWDTKLWDEIQAYIPNMGNGSRVLITTRITTVARHASPNEPCFLRFLGPEESWGLFEKKVFRGDRCSPKLEPLGLEIVSKCKGLPLSIVVIASMLASKEKSKWIWERTLADVSVPLGEDEACLAIVAISYYNLPSELRPCFLYFAAFPEDYEISVRGLITLWVAEGLIQPQGKLSLEEVAEGYLYQLIDRSLVQAGNKRTDGRLKTCRIHNLVRDLCIKEAESEKFMWQASRMQDCSSTINKFKPRRVSLQQQGITQSYDWASSSVRAFINFDLNINSISSGMWKTLCSKYRLLRVLDLGESRGVQYDDFSNLINLRYLKLFLSSKSIPESLFNLWNLQMLFLEGSETYKIPLKALLKLRHLHQLVIGKGGKGHIISGYRSSLVSKRPLQSLTVLSTTCPSSAFESAVATGLCPNLRKLAVQGANGGWSLERYLAALGKLQVLKISNYDSNVKQNIFRGVQEYSLPKNLTKITLKSSKWSDASMSMLGKFPKLTILKLINLPHPRLIAPEGSFLRLNTLYLDTIGGGEVRFSHNNSTQLQHLIVKNCACSFDKYTFMLPGLNVIDISCPHPRLEILLEKLKRENKIKCKLVMH